MIEDWEGLKMGLTMIGMCVVGWGLIPGMATWLDTRWTEVVATVSICGTFAFLFFFWTSGA